MICMQHPFAVHVYDGKTFAPSAQWAVQPAGFPVRVRDIIACRGHSLRTDVMMEKGAG